mmetsp:Transcript_11576/g.36724  ORF Transcript_11576/g.36724 Transcript_11576/m.36724 type:complete len:331 (+) Transcript_11576:230-1222(+)
MKSPLFPRLSRPRALQTPVHLGSIRPVVPRLKRPGPPLGHHRFVEEPEDVRYERRNDEEIARAIIARHVDASLSCRHADSALEDEVQLVGTMDVSRPCHAGSGLEHVETKAADHEVVHGASRVAHDRRDANHAVRGRRRVEMPDDIRLDSLKLDRRQQRVCCRPPPGEEGDGQREQQRRRQEAGELHAAQLVMLSELRCARDRVRRTGPIAVVRRPTAGLSSARQWASGATSSSTREAASVSETDTSASRRCSCSSRSAPHSARGSYTNASRSARIGSRAERSTRSTASHADVKGPSTPHGPSALTMAGVIRNGTVSATLSRKPFSKHTL